MRLAVIGAGYVGLVSGVCLAEVGHEVCVIDIEKDKVARLKKGHSPIYEPQLTRLLRINLARGRLRFTLDAAAGIRGAHAIFLALPTPPNETDKSADMRFLLKAVDELVPLLGNEYTVLVNKSTVPVGTSESVAARLPPKAPIEVVSNPEFLREGCAVEDFMKPDRIIIGTSSAKARQYMQHIYAPFAAAGTPILYMEPRSSELAKYAANTFLATKISFVNEMARLCDLLGADIEEIRQSLAYDPRIGKEYLSPGIGFGGSCLPKDIAALCATAHQHKHTSSLLDAIREVNIHQILYLFYRARAAFKGQLKGKTFAIWGLAFKPETDDIREAPALYNIEALLAEGVHIRAYDPEAMPTTKQKLGDKIHYAEDPYDALQGADALMLMTEWPIFYAPNWIEVAQRMNNVFILDGRNIYDPVRLSKEGFTYIGVGRAAVSQSNSS